MASHQDSEPQQPTSKNSKFISPIEKEKASARWGWGTFTILIIAFVGFLLAVGATVAAYLSPLNFLPLDFILNAVGLGAAAEVFGVGSAVAVAINFVVATLLYSIATILLNMIFASVPLSFFLQRHNKGDTYQSSNKKEEIKEEAIENSINLDEMLKVNSKEEENQNNENEQVIEKIETSKKKDRKPQKIGDFEAYTIEGSAFEFVGTSNSERAYFIVNAAAHNPKPKVESNGFSKWAAEKWKPIQQGLFDSFEGMDGWGGISGLIRDSIKFKTTRGLKQVDSWTVKVPNRIKGVLDPDHNAQYKEFAKEWKKGEEQDINNPGNARIAKDNNDAALEFVFETDKEGEATKVGGVIHCFAPRVSKDGIDEAAYKNAVLNVLKEAYEYSKNNNDIKVEVAIAPPGIGIFGNPPAWAARLFYQSMNEFYTEYKDAPNHLRIIVPIYHGEKNAEFKKELHECGVAYEKELAVKSGLQNVKAVVSASGDSISFYMSSSEDTADVKITTSNVDTYNLHPKIVEMIKNKSQNQSYSTTIEFLQQLLRRPELQKSVNVQREQEKGAAAEVSSNNDIYKLIKNIDDNRKEKQEAYDTGYDYQSGDKVLAAWTNYRTYDGIDSTYRLNFKTGQSDKAQASPRRTF